MLKLENIIKNYDLDQNTKVEALKGINLVFNDKDFVSILGPSGCGKTTLLNIIGGLDHYTDGDLIIDDISTKNYKDIDWDIYRNNRIGFVFQSYNLIQHLTLLENVEMPLILNGIDKKTRVEKATKALERVGLSKEKNKKPNQLSGGQMQRVAIARALVNDPEIILADEPTGALDSETSVVVLDLLKEISKDKLVIMVTHNEKLAYLYSTRVITMLDGNVTSDKRISEEKEKESSYSFEEAKLNKTSMSFTTSFKLSIKNILTKKGRTILTAVASSVGIIGVGLVLAISNGFNDYITRVEEATASNSPITISSVSYSYSSNPNAVDYERFPTDDNLYVYDEETNSVVRTTHLNKLNNEYLAYLDNIYNTEYGDSVASILTLYNNFNINLVSKVGDDNYVLVNPYDSVASSITSTVSSVTGLPNYIFHELYGDSEYILKSYDVLEGTYPSEEMTTDSDGNNVFEVALIVDQYNRLDKKSLVNLGLYTEQELEGIDKISFSDLIGREYAFSLNDDLYRQDLVDELYGENSFDVLSSFTYPEQEVTLTYRDFNGVERSYSYTYPGGTAYQYADLLANYKVREYVYKNSKNRIRISGIIRVKEDSMLDYMNASIGYNKSLKDYILSENSESELVKNAANNLKIYGFGDRDSDSISGIGLNTIFTQYNYFPLLAQLTGQEIQTPSWAQDLQEATYTHLEAAINNMFIAYPITQQRGSIINNSGENKVDYSFYASDSYVYSSTSGYLSVLNSYGYMFELSDEDQSNLDSITSILDQYLDSYLNGDLSANFLLLYLRPYMNSIIQSKTFLVYVASMLSNYQNIRTIILFPSSLTLKPMLKEYLDNYNIDKVDSEQVIYTDLIGTLTDSLGEVINIISWVLVAFGSVSLVVSSVMTGIITYNSVLERTKEIGILRAVGARKKDVGRLFKTESLVIGVFSGLIGIILTYILSVPINLILNSMFPDYNIGSIANLNVVAALILVSIAGLLAFISSVIPARIAAKKEPVESLRSE